MNKNTLNVAALLFAMTAANVGITLWLIHRDTSSAEPASKTAQGQGEQREVLYWYDPMVPDQHFDQPGKSPFMDMELVPKYADEAGSTDAAVKINPGVVQNLGVRTTQVTRTELTSAIEAAANVQFNDRDVAIVQTRSAGFVERSYDLAPGDVIKQGAPLADLLIPAWSGALEEYLAVLTTHDRALIDATRQRLTLMGIPATLIERVEKNRRAQPIITIHAPIGGAVQRLDVRAGMALEKGAPLAVINGLDTVWLEAAVPEAQADQVRIGQAVTARLTAYPGETFEGQVIAVLPTNDPSSRTLQVRIALPNPELRLRPGMFARVQLESTAESVLTVPSEAVLHGGQRDYVLVANDEGGFTPSVVTLGAQSGQQTVIRDGLQEGQRVVASGQFLIDSEASLAGALDRLGKAASSADGSAHDMDDMAGMDMGAMEENPEADEATAPIESRGRVEDISAAQVTLSHEPIPALDWPAMTMPFELADPALADGLEVGDTVTFTMREGDSGYIIERLQMSGGAQ
ncbi:efflux RND transporter periplasmic adaptor subunit [Phytohalomonas tamaricis]|uniref:efflux RND transporter periplasmic adaptor subunit n=1 Tax=Phytohalomonas tamaricis TaxID=2081032 RepID=UPI000D0ACCAA|nr:efflux RND transporter periplasmic adaptor subunit [Phytohalomonas tamaricis]